jgi:hypothetical protein
VDPLSRPKRRDDSSSMVKAWSTWIPARLSAAIAEVSPPHFRALRVAAFIRMLALCTVIARSGSVASESTANVGSTATMTATMPMTTRALGRNTDSICTRESCTLSTSDVSRADRSPTGCSRW